MDVMSLTRQKIFEKGCNFTHAYVTTPLCCPSRASILTGMYASSHGVTHNFFPLQRPTFVERLKNEGDYYTGYVGKFLNTSDGNKRPEYDYWASQKGGGAQFRSPFLNVNGSWQHVEGYSTHIFRDKALEFLNLAAAQEKPFFLFVGFHAPHRPSLVAPEDRDPKLRSKYCTRDIYRGLDLLRNAAATKSPELKYKLAMARENICEQRLSLLAVDRAISQLVDSLEQKGVLRNTAIFFISDNGLLRGEHSRFGKNIFYEEAVHVPFAIRHDNVIAPQVSDKLVANIDIAPTVLSMAGLPVSPEMQGASLLGAINGAPWREDLLLEGFSDIAVNGEFAALHAKDRVLVRLSLKNGATKMSLFDLQADKSERTDFSSSPAYKEVRDNLLSRLDQVLTTVRKQ